MVAQAALNNALWCDAVSRANGAPGEFHASIWLNRHRVPPFYPNAVTLTPDGAAGQLDLIAELAAGRRALSVKDSFRTLDLRPLGFEILFEATWLSRPAGLTSPVAPDGWSWSVISTESELARWEAAWTGAQVGQLIPDSERIFRPPLLAEPGVIFLAGSRGGAMAAVAAVNLTGDVAGLSNVFAPDEEAAAWPGAVALASSIFPGRPLVDYERGDDLAQARAAGFTPLDDLRVWVRNEPAQEPR